MVKEEEDSQNRPPFSLEVAVGNEPSDKITTKNDSNSTGCHTIILPDGERKNNNISYLNTALNNNLTNSCSNESIRVTMIQQKDVGGTYSSIMEEQRKASVPPIHPYTSLQPLRTAVVAKEIPSPSIIQHHLAQTLKHETTNSSPPIQVNKTSDETKYYNSNTIASTKDMDSTSTTSTSISPNYLTQLKNMPNSSSPFKSAVNSNQTINQTKGVIPSRSPAHSSILGHKATLTTPSLSSRQQSQQELKSPPPTTPQTPVSDESGKKQKMITSTILTTSITSPLPSSSFVDTLGEAGCKSNGYLSLASSSSSQPPLSHLPLKESGQKLPPTATTATTMSNINTKPMSLPPPSLSPVNAGKNTTLPFQSCNGDHSLSSLGRPMQPKPPTLPSAATPITGEVKPPSLNTTMLQTYQPTTNVMIQNTLVDPEHDGMISFQKGQAIRNQNTIQRRGPPTREQIANAIPSNASSVFYIFDRRVNFDTQHRSIEYGEDEDEDTNEGSRLVASDNDVSFYSLLRAWVQDDPYRYNAPPGSNLLDHIAVPSMRRNCHIIGDDLDKRDKGISSSSSKVVTARDKCTGKRKRSDGHNERDNMKNVDVLSLLSSRQDDDDDSSNTTSALQTEGKTLHHDAIITTSSSSTIPSRNRDDRINFDELTEMMEDDRISFDDKLNVLTKMVDQFSSNADTFAKDVQALKNATMSCKELLESHVTRAKVCKEVKQKTFRRRIDRCKDRLEGLGISVER